MFNPDHNDFWITNRADRINKGHHQFVSMVQGDHEVHGMIYLVLVLSQYQFTAKNTILLKEIKTQILFSILLWYY